MNKIYGQKDFGFVSRIDWNNNSVGGFLRLVL